MEWKIYEEWLDITLYRQMTNLIYKLSSNEEKYKIYMQLKENDMFLEKPKVDMETAYGLHYPGEVLERIGEDLTWTKRTYRALGLALARMMPLQETCMFNGTQKNLFWKKMKQILGEKDLFLISISYICEEKENLKAHEYLQGNEKCSNSPETDRKERGRFLYECGQTGKSAGTFQSDGGVK